MGDGTANIHFGKCDGIDLDEEGAYGKASEQMTDHMYDLAMDLHGAEGDKKISYVDLGSGTGAAPCGCARNTTPSRRQLASTCATSRTHWRQNAPPERIAVVTGTYEEAPFEDDSFDMSLSQDAFVHAFSKVKTYSEALRITRPGGVFVFCEAPGSGSIMTVSRWLFFALLQLGGGIQFCFVM